MINKFRLCRKPLGEQSYSPNNPLLDLSREQFKSMVYAQCYESWIREDCANFKLQSLMHKSLENGLVRSHFSEVLEVGARNLEHFNHVRHSFDSYLLTDIEEISNISESLNSFDERLKFQVDDISNSKLLSNSFDRVIVTCVLHHVSDVESSLLAIRRVMRIGATASILLPCDPGLIFRTAKKIGPYRRARKGNYYYIKRLMDARDHVNHHIGIRTLIYHVFRQDSVSVRYYPINFPIYDFNIWAAFTIKKRID